MLNLLHSQRIFAYVSQHLVCRVPLHERRIALTFDDGPNPAVTPRLLDLLDAHGARATFFLIGRNAARFPRLAAEVAARGHELGNHSHDHLALPVLPRPLLLRQMERAAGAIHAAAGVRPHLFRPPHGWFSRRMLRWLAEQGYVPVLGDVYPQDTLRPGAPVLAARVLARVQAGSIVILHDGSALGTVNRHQTVDALEAALPRLRAAGYAVGTVGELLLAGARAVMPACGAPPAP